MKNTLTILKLGLVSAWLVLSLACGSQNQNGGNSSNLSADNGNSKTKSNSNQPTESASVPANTNPSEACGWLEQSFEIKPEKYDLLSGKNTYLCSQN